MTRSKFTDEIRGLVRRMAEENPDRGALGSHGELQKVRFAVSERSVARYLQRIRRGGDPGKRWLAFLQNHPCKRASRLGSMATFLPAAWI